MDNLDNIVHDRSCTYRINYYIVFTTSGMKKVLTKKISDYMKKIMMDTSIDKKFHVNSIDVTNRNTVHVYASGKPKTDPSYILLMLKSIAARKILLIFPDLEEKMGKNKGAGSLWNYHYYLETVGGVSEEGVLEYLKSQGG